MLILRLILIVVISIIILLCLFFFTTPLFSKVPFIPTRKKVLNEIILALGLSSESVLYDLGCGDGRILFTACQIYQGITCIGIEKAPFPFCVARIRKLFYKDKNVSIVYGDMFKHDLSSATHIFLFLFPILMDSLLPKFEKELKPGTKVISCDFKFSKKEPTKVIHLKANKSALNRTLYVYDF